MRTVVYFAFELPWKLGSLENGYVDTLPGKRSGSICASWAASDDQNLNMLFIEMISLLDDLDVPDLGRQRRRRHVDRGREGIGSSVAIQF
jgi:hypothetical protein